MDFTYASLDPVPVTKPGPHAARELRTHQGIPSIERLPNGRLFAVWYTGGTSECRENYVMLVVSDDGGQTWTDAVAVVDPPHPVVRAFDSNLWLGPDGVLRWFWSQSCGGRDGEWSIYDGIGGVFVSELENPLDPPEQFRFTPSRRIANGIMMNKPTVLKDGTWALPCALWTGNYLQHPSLNIVPGAYLVASTDGGATYHPRGHVDMHQVEGGSVFDEHQFVEFTDGTLHCFLRVKRGVAESVSTDQGRTWSEPRLATSFSGPCSRFFIARLQSGRLLLVNNDSTTAREKMTAYLSEDDGQSWPYHLLLDARNPVSYPDATQAPDGEITIIHDFARAHGGNILVSRIREEDIIAGSLVTPTSVLCQLAGSSKPVPKKEETAN